MTKSYLKGESTEDIHLRITDKNMERLKKKEFKEEKSINLLINEIIEQTTTPDKQHNFKSEKSKLVYDLNDKIKIYKNDFVDVDLENLYEKVGLIVTSPPYNLNIDYNSYSDSMDYNAYINTFSRLWLKKAYKLLETGGRMCLNIPLDKNKGGLRSVYADIVEVAKEVGFGYQSTIIWNEQNISRRTAWGSWLSASAPYVIAPVEMIVLLYKNQWKKEKDGETNITKKEFKEWTNGVWNFSGESKKRVGHPAPFPVELPWRSIKLFSYENELVMDPFLGSGTTLIAANRLNRRAIGVEIDQEYIDLAKKRVNESNDLFAQKDD